MASCFRWGSTGIAGCFTAKGIDHFFDGGIFGSPNTKDEILAREINHRNIIDPAVLLVTAVMIMRLQNGLVLILFLLSNGLNLRVMNSFYF